ncbi:MAG: hypothetical protein ACFCUG_10665 [Thiotrichales bacterium]
MIHSGFLSVQTHREHPGLVFVAHSEQPPLADDSENATVETWFVAEFEDIEAARMHAHEALKRSGAGTDLFRTDIITAIAAIDAIILPHRRAYIAHTLSPQDHAAIEQATRALGQRHRSLNKLGNLVGKLAIGLLVGYSLLTLILALLRGG